MSALVVRGYGEVDELGGGVGVAKTDDGDVDIGGFFDGLRVGARIRHDDEAWLLEGPGDVVGEVAGSEAASDRNGTSVRGELEDRTLAIGTGGDDANVRWIVNGDDDSRGKDNFLPSCTCQRDVRGAKFPDNASVKK